MGLEIQRKKDGALKSNWWYGRFEVVGKSHCVNLGIEIKGRVPATLRETGDTTFECSRTLAAAKLKELMEQAQNKKTAAHHLQELYEIKAGDEITQVPVAEIGRQWTLLPTRRKRSALWEKNQQATLKAFSDFISEHYPKTTFLSQVTAKMARDWLQSLEEKGYAPATYNDKLHLLRGFFERIGHDAGTIKNPFAGIPTRERNTIHHQPFTQEELNRILEKATGAIRSVFLVGKYYLRERR